LYKKETLFPLKKAQQQVEMMEIVPFNDYTTTRATSRCNFGTLFVFSPVVSLDGCNFRGEKLTLWPDDEHLAGKNEIEMQIAV
jgi:hypothetical protein